MMRKLVRLQTRCIPAECRSACFLFFLISFYLKRPAGYPVGLLHTQLFSALRAAVTCYPTVILTARPAALPGVKTSVFRALLAIVCVFLVIHPGGIFFFRHGSPPFTRKAVPIFRETFFRLLHLSPVPVVSQFRRHNSTMTACP